MIELLYFFIIIVVIYFILTNIKVVHSSTLPAQDKQELQDRNKIRSMLMSNHIRHISPDSSTPIAVSTVQPASKPITYPSGQNLLAMINEDFVDGTYHFNLVNQPVTTRSFDSINNGEHYINHIKSSINEWNHVLTRDQIKQCRRDYRTACIVPMQIKPIFIKETIKEFVITVNTKIRYLTKYMYLQLVYYGLISKSDDFMSNARDTWTLQLIDLKVISPIDYNSSVEKIHPFMTMDDQLSYVEKVNKMHQNE